MPEALLLLLRSVAVHGDIDAGAVWGRGQPAAVEVVPACYGGLGVCNQVGDSRWACLHEVEGDGAVFRQPDVGDGLAHEILALGIGCKYGGGGV